MNKNYEEPMPHKSNKNRAYAKCFDIIASLINNKKQNLINPNLFFLVSLFLTRV